MAPEFGKSIHQLPLVPANILKKHCVHEPLARAGRGSVMKTGTTMFQCFCYIRSTQAIQSRDKDDLTVILWLPMLLRSLSRRNTVNGKDTEASGG
jgi:hypothetical protein